jgi:hypothetical protein
MTARKKRKKQGEGGESIKLKRRKGRRVGKKI